LCIAAQEGHLECVRTLLEWGANPVHSDRCGRTPIRVAMKSGHVSISKLLEEIALARTKTRKIIFEFLRSIHGLSQFILQLNLILVLSKGLNANEWEDHRSDETFDSKPSNIFNSSGFYRSSENSTGKFF